MSHEIRGIVLISYNFPPQNDAEALCTARLATALVNRGLPVTVVTCDPPRSLEPGIERELLSTDVEVIRVPAPKSSAISHLGLSARLGLHAPHLAWTDPAVETVRRLLHERPGRVLISRAMPVVSNVVGYYCRERALCWAAHFSDPYPMVHGLHRRRLSRLVEPLHFRWARRILRSADLITVTCANAVRYIEEITKLDFREKLHVLTHVALPKLAPGTFRFERNAGEFWLAHIGNLMTQRNPEVLFRGFLKAAAKAPELRLLQYGNIDPGVQELLASEAMGGAIDVRHSDNLSPRDATDLREQVDANVIVDADYGLAYSPFIASKYPHSVASGRPILMMSAPDSAMGDYWRKHGGGVLASFRDPDDVARAILDLVDAKRRGDTRYRPTETLIHEFSPDRIVKPFIERLEKLVRGKGPTPA